MAKELHTKGKQCIFFPPSKEVVCVGCIKENIVEEGLLKKKDKEEGLLRVSV